MRDFPLEAQMRACGKEADTATVYRLVKLPMSSAKPGLVLCRRGGGMAVHYLESNGPRAE